MSAKLVYLLFIVSLIAYFITGYQLNRSNFVLLITLYSFLFAIYFLILHHKNHINLPISIITGLIFRFSLLFCLPALSDDYYRFLWDGRLQQLGINPFDYAPSQLAELTTDAFLRELYPKLNSPDYFSVYPQLLQYVFKLVVQIAGQSVINAVIILKAIIFLFECGSIYLLIRLLKMKGLDPKNSLIYIFNPLVIIELTGNIHFEAIMIFFILLSAYFISRSQIAGTVGALTLAIQAKLIPVIAIPLLIKKVGFIKTVWIGFTCFLLFWISSPFLWGGVERYLHFISSLQLYYGKFEFNGSIYSLFRGTGYWLTGFNQIYWTSKLLVLLTLALFIYIYRSSKDFLQGFFWLMAAYLLFSAVVHPWYLAILVALSPFVFYRFAMIWSALVPLTYITYSIIPYQQNYWIIGLEYCVVVAFVTFESGFLKKGSQIFDGQVS
ncbi:MAG: hypothetical protein H7096_01670 [Flavobacterium sp.]|nr:hypothetical protein [Pedobacter sp.]